ncbi:MAG TPA: hypothetical protein VIK31_10105 [Propionibacteriaceae bacterium]
MTGGDETPRGSGLPDPGAVSAPPGWGPAPRRWVPGPSWAGTTQTSDAPAARRSALTPLPEDDDEIVSAPRRSALSPRDDEDLDDAVVPRRSALSPLPADDQPATAARRSAFTPSEPDDDPAPRRSAWLEEDDDEDEGYEETLRLPLPRRSSEYATAARAIQPALPDLGPTPESPESPVEAFSPVEPPSPVTDATSPPSPSVQPTLPDPVLPGPIEAEFANTELLPVTVPEATMAAAAVAAEDLTLPVIAELTAAVAEVQELLAEEGDMVSEGAPVADQDTSSVGDDTATWLFGSAFSDADHSLYKRPAPGEPETEVDLTPIVIDDPEYDARKGTSPRAKSTPRPSRTTRTKPSRGTSARRMHVAWRDHKRLLTLLSIVLALLLVVGVGGYLFSRYNPTLAAINEGNLTLPLSAGDYRRDPSQGSSPSADPNGKIQTVSATYSRGGEQQFVAIAYRPQTDPTAALEEIQARSVTRVNGGACGRTTDQNRLACAVVSGATAVLLMTLVDQSPDELIAAAQSVASGIGKT